MIRAKDKKATKSRTRESAGLSISTRLRPLIEFLNYNVDRLKRETASGELKMLIHQDLSAPWFDTLKEEIEIGGGYGRFHLKALQTELIEALSPIATLPEGGAKRFNRRGKVRAADKMDSHLKSLLAKINQLKFEPVFKLLPGQRKVKLNSSDLFRLAVHDLPPGQPRAHLWEKMVINPAHRIIDGREQAIFSWGAGKWIVRMEFSSGVRYSPERDFYGIIAEGLMTGELARIRQCAYCKTFFAASQPRLTFCPGHARKYYDMIKFHPELTVGARRGKNFPR